MKLHAKKETIRKYYKVITETLNTLPIFQNEVQATQGVDGVSVLPNSIWQAVGQSIATNVPNSYGVYYTFNFEYLANITSFTFQGRVIGGQLPTANMQRFEIYNIDTGQWNTLWTGSVGATLQTINVSNDKYSNQYRIYLTGSEVGRYANMGLYTINMTGNKKETLPATQDDYDFYEDIEVWKSQKEVIRKYYKYSEPTPFIQPTLTSNGILGGDSFAVTSTYGSCYDGSTDISQAYKVFDNDTSTRFGMWSNSETTPQTLTFYSPNLLNFSSLTVSFHSNAYAIWRAKNGNLKASNDGINWVEIANFTNNASATLTLNNSSDNYYKYYAFTGTLLTHVSNSIDMNIISITLNNAFSKTIEPATEDDYDFYEDTIKYYASTQGV